MNDTVLTVRQSGLASSPAYINPVSKTQTKRPRPNGATDAPSTTIERASEDVRNTPNRRRFKPPRPDAKAGAMVLFL